MLTKVKTVPRENADTSETLVTWSATSPLESDSDTIDPGFEVTEVLHQTREVQSSFFFLQLVIANHPPGGAKVSPLTQRVSNYIHIHPIVNEK